MEYSVMTVEMFSKFGDKGENAKSMDTVIRKVFKIPDNRYYSVTVYPSPVGRIFIDKTRYRVVESNKLSKSE
jgi:hypothetical protein